MKETKRSLKADLIVTMVLLLTALHLLTGCAPPAVNPSSRAFQFDGSYNVIASDCVATPPHLFIELGIIRELPAVDAYDTNTVNLSPTGVLSIKGESGCVATFQRVGT